MELGPGPAGNPGMSGRPGSRGEGGDMGPPVCTSLIYNTILLFYNKTLCSFHTFLVNL